LEKICVQFIFELQAICVAAKLYTFEIQQSNYKSGLLQEHINLHKIAFKDRKTDCTRIKDFLQSSPRFDPAAHQSLVAPHLVGAELKQTRIFI
jgi:hypothetical protein